MSKKKDFTERRVVYQWEDKFEDVKYRIVEVGEHDFGTDYYFEYTSKDAMGKVRWEGVSNYRVKGLAKELARVIEEAAKRD
jgi:hypothetical protein